LLLKELLQEIFGRLSLTFSPLVKNRLEKTFIELGHAPEGRPSVKEIEFLVVLLILFAVRAV
jgi:hypothetical protein